MKDVSAAHNFQVGIIYAEGFLFNYVAGKLQSRLQAIALNVSHQLVKQHVLPLEKLCCIEKPYAFFTSYLMFSLGRVC